MAELINKLNIKYSNIIDECVCYTTSDEATPKTISEGSYWEIKNNNTICYLGLWPVNENQDSGFHSKLKIKKNGIEYYVEKKVLNEFTVTIEQSEHQTIKVICNGYTYTETFKALAGSQFTVVVEPEVGYTAGKPNYLSGYVTNDITIFASYASLEAYYITLIPGNNQTLKVTLNGDDKLSFTSSFVAAYGDTYAVEIIPDEGYEAGEIVGDIPLSGKFNGTTRLKATEVNAKYFIVNIDQSLNQIIKVICNGEEYTSTFTAPYGSTYTVTVTPNTGYNAGTLNHTSGTITGNITISATAATLKKYTITVTQPANGKITVNGSVGTSFTYNAGTSVKVQATANSGYKVTALNVNKTTKILSANIKKQEVS
ncbi:Uncharacterised protein [Megamonas hypermegale]|uniref:Bacterial repeat domain-containing protein n=1 Tax=Megamonas hypermegale TaxID=158847 RepID=A0A378NSG7_9FIRM|nr:hypothetical protein [Megamonas hypermegale]STY71324.1 Uncharacterised protein [Megamonas hypermegale]